MSSDNGLVGRVSSQEFLGHRTCPVVYRHQVSPIGEVEGEIGPHHSKSDNSQVRLRCHAWEATWLRLVTDPDLSSLPVATKRIGVDIGGSGVKAGVVDVERGRLMGKRIRTETPEPATPDAVVKSVVDLIGQMGVDGPVGVGFPAVIDDGLVLTANNIDPTWIGLNAKDLIGRALGREVVVANDADCAGLAEAAHGAALGIKGTVLVLTFGTGIGTALISDGRLVANLELGQVELSGVRPAELKYSAKARRRENLDWAAWGARTNEFLAYAYSIFNPVLIVVGGGVSKNWSRIAPHLDPDLPVVPAVLGNDAGIVGAALLAANG